VLSDAQASKELTAVQTDFLQYIFQAINNLLTQNLGFFDSMGQNLSAPSPPSWWLGLESSPLFPPPVAGLAFSSIILQACC
jgi:hypothetical protein